jgi:Uma2 family endonuclease
MATTRLWTVEELEREGAPEGRWELIDGELVEMSPSGRRATRIGVRFARFLGNHVDPLGLGEVYGADGGFVMFPGRELLRVPDAAFVRAERLVGQDEERFLRLAPDLVVEVISPGDRDAEVAAKVEMWLDAGVRLVWVADPPARTVTIHVPGVEPRVLREGDELDGGVVLPGFRVAVAELFA